MKLDMIKQFLFFSIPEKHKEEFRKETYKINLARGKTTAKVFIALEIILLLNLMITQKETLFNAPNIYYGTMYSLMIIVMAIYLIIMHKVNKRKIYNLNIGRCIVISFTFFMFLWSCGVSIIDQLSYGQVIVYVVGIVSVAIIPFLEPFYLMIIYSIIHSFFIIGLIYFQKSTNVLLENCINTSTFVVVLWFVSRMLFKNRVKEFINRKIIEQKNEELNYINNKLEVANKKLVKFSYTDYLTGLYNRHKFDQIIEHEWESYLRESKALSIIMIDIDYFKQFNDGYGHQHGDGCLKQVAEVLALLSEEDSVTAARYGGEEFAVILSNTDIDHTFTFAEKIRKNVEAIAIPHAYSKVSKNITVSLGTYTIIPSKNLSIKEFIGAADSALYEAKMKNRNRVVCGNKEHRKAN